MNKDVAAVLREAGKHRWCTKAVCTTCGASEFRHAVARVADDSAALVTDLAGMDLPFWYEVEDIGGAVAIVFAALPDQSSVARVLSSWRDRVRGHTRVIDAVVFRVVRAGHVPEPERAAWLSIARSEALSTKDASLLETLVYTLGPNIMRDPALLSAAIDCRRGYAPLHRAINKTLGHLGAEA